LNITDILAWLEATRVAVSIRDSLYLFPLIESMHVLGLTMVFGTVVIVDLRLLGLASTRRPFTSIAYDTLRWTWVAFALTVATGLLMFITNARVYSQNSFFQAKMASIALAGLNMLAFQLTSSRSIDDWDLRAAPRAGRIAAVASLLLWLTVIFLGRWVGFTTTHATPTNDSDVNIEDLLPK
jgi:hypothetical protein